MNQLLLGLLLFFGTHSISIIAPGWRDRMAAKNELAWKLVYGLIALAGVVLIVQGYGELRQHPTVVYTTPGWMRHLAAVLLLPVFIFFFAPYLPGRIKSTLKHPQLVAAKLWAFSHLLVNGTVADLLLFGSFLAWAVADRISLKKRPTRAVPGAPESALNDIILIVVGLALYFVFFIWLHELLIGVRPI